MKHVWMAALMLAACVDAEKANSEWVLASVDGAAVDYTATLSLAEAGRVTGQAPCNRYFADVTRQGDSVKLGMIGASRLACLQIKGEVAYFQTLQGVDTLIESPARLILSGAGHEMVFMPAAQPAL